MWLLKKKAVYLGFILVTQATQGYAQDDGIQQYLAHVIDAHHQSLSGELIQVTRGYVADDMSSWLEGTELRFSTDNNNDAKQSVVLRLKIKDSSQLDIEQEIAQLGWKLRDLDILDSLNQNLEIAYLQILALVAEYEQLSHLQNELNLQEAAIKFYREQVQSNDFQPGSLLESELDHELTGQEIKLRQRRLNDIKRSMNYTQDIPELTLSEIFMLKFGSQIGEQQSSEVERAHVELMVHQKKIQHQQAGDGFGLTAVQFQSEFQDNQDDALAIRFDFRIPFGGSNSRAAGYSSASQAAVRLHQLNQQQSLRVSGLQQQMTHQHDVILNAERFARRLRIRIDKASNADIILKLRKQYLTQQEKIMRARQDMRKAYIELLAVHALLAKRTNMNWLAPYATSDTNG